VSEIRYEGVVFSDGAVALRRLDDDPLEHRTWNFESVRECNEELGRHAFISWLTDARQGELPCGRTESGAAADRLARPSRIGRRNQQRRLIAQLLALVPQRTCAEEANRLLEEAGFTTRVADYDLVSDFHHQVRSEAIQLGLYDDGEEPP
jgi:hypothetical protein